jgi:hypothetical protein
MVNKVPFQRTQAQVFAIARFQAHFPPNYIFISFVYLTLDNMTVNKGGLASKDPCNTQNNSNGLQKSFKMPLFRHFVWGRFFEIHHQNSDDAPQHHSHKLVTPRTPTYA